MEDFPWRRSPSACFLKMVVPPFHTPKWSFFSRKKNLMVVGEIHHFRVHPHRSFHEKRCFALDPSAWVKLPIATETTTTRGPVQPPFAFGKPIWFRNHWTHGEEVFSPCEISRLFGGWEGGWKKWVGAISKVTWKSWIYGCQIAFV